MEKDLNKLLEELKILKGQRLKKEAQKRVEIEQEKEELKKKKIEKSLEWMKKTQPNVYYKEGIFNPEWFERWRKAQEEKERRERGLWDSGI